VNGRPITTQRRNSAGTQIGRINRAYDPHGRLATLTDDRNGTSTWQYYTTNDLVRAVVTPPSGTGDPSRTTLHEYDVVGRVNLERAVGSTDCTDCTDFQRFEQDVGFTSRVRRSAGSRIESRAVPSVKSVKSVENPNAVSKVNRVTHPDGNVVHTSYTLRGEVSATDRCYPPNRMAGSDMRAGGFDVCRLWPRQFNCGQYIATPRSNAVQYPFRTLGQPSQL
jgi:YD repeat-containing protein